MKLSKIKLFVAWLLEKVSGDKRPPFEYAKPDPEEKANRPSSSDSEETNVYILGNHSIWPQTEKRKDTDRIYQKLTGIFDPSRIRQVGGRNGRTTPVAYWSVYAVDEELTRLQEIQAEEVSENWIILEQRVPTMIIVTEARDSLLKSTSQSGFRSSTTQLVEG